MSGIISIGKFRRMKEKEDREWQEMDRKIEAFDQAVAADEEKQTEESAIAVMAAMIELVSAMAGTPFGRQVAREQQKWDVDFRKRYQNVFANAPDMPVARIKFFCKILMKLWPAVMEGAGIKGLWRMMIFSACIWKG